MTCSLLKAGNEYQSVIAVTVLIYHLTTGKASLPAFLFDILLMISFALFVLV
jgi:hypothetical protein